MIPGARLADRYEIVHPLGAGGMGEVFLARDATLERDVAIKVLPASLSTDGSARERFRREALAAAALDHPFLCKIFEIGEADGRLFIVMEFVAGETLHAALERGPIAPGALVALALELTDALEAAHARRIVHRDLKPANIMLTSQRHSKVMDFGLAKLVPDESADTRFAGGAPLTHQGVRVGTPAYMSPEQVAGEAVDHRSDLFSLGVVLTEALTGVHPFARPTVAATMTAVLSEPPLVQVVGDATESGQSLRAVLLRMMAKSPDARYQSAVEVRQDLQSLRQWGSSRDAAVAVPLERADSTPRAHRWAMVGRDAERAELVRGMEAALSGHGSIVMIGGEPGIGKTRLTEELLAEARRRGASAVVGHCYEMQGSPPYVPFVEILEYTARVVPPAALRRLLGDDAPEVTRLMPELRRMFSDIPAPIELPAEQQRWHFFNAFRAYVARACSIAPIVAVFEDLHWADEPTLQLLLHTAQQVSSIPLFLVGTYRDVELDVNRPFAKVLEALLRQRLATRIALRRLPASSVDALLQAMSGKPAPSSLVQVVFRETEGNPFFIEEVFQHLVEEGRLFTEDGEWRSDLRMDTLEVPEGVRLVIGRRLERLTDDARRVLTTAAVIGRVFSLSLLEQLETKPGTGSADAVLDAIEEAQHAHLVKPHGSGRDAQYTFEHELIRQTLADGLSLPRRQRLHARIALAIESLYAATLDKHASALALHFYQAGAGVDLDKTTQYLVKAAEQARDAAAHEEALEYIDNARSLWEGDRSERVADLLDRRAAALASLGRAREAIDSGRHAAALWLQHSRLDRYAAAIMGLSHNLAWMMDLTGALTELDRALGVLGSAPNKVRAPLVYQHAVGLVLSDAVTEGAAKLDEAEALRRQLQDPELDALALAVSAQVHWGTGRIEEARTLQRGAREALTALGRLWQASDGGFIEVWGEAYCGNLSAASALVEELEPLAARIGHQGAQWALRTAHMNLALVAGDLTGAEREARDIVEFGRTHAIPWAYHTKLHLAICLLLQGKADEAVVVAREATASEQPSYYSYNGRGVLFRCLAYADPDQARAYRHETDIPLPVAGSLNSFGRWMNLAAVIDGLHVLGEREQLAGLLPLAELRLDRATRVTVEGGLLPEAAAGIVAAAAGRWDAAEAYLASAIALADDRALAIHQGSARESYADMLMQRGTDNDVTRARELYADAAARYEEYGMTLFATRLAERRG